MENIVYSFFRGVVFLFSLLSFDTLYKISDFLAWLFYHKIGYRKKVVLENLRTSFPQKTEEEIQTIAYRFYRHLTDITLESLKGFSMSKEEILARYHLRNPEISDAFFEQGKNLIGVSAHYGNWEWGALVISLSIKHKTVIFYKPLSNKRIDRYMRQKREQWGVHLRPIQDTRRIFLEKTKKPTVYVMLSDQNPSNVKRAHWVHFLGRDTACLHGAEDYAREFDYPMVYATVFRTQRGHYEIITEPLTETPREHEKGEITQKFMSRLEEIICQKPEAWLWSHRRWKHKRNAE